MERLMEELMARIPLEQINKLCDALRGLLIHISSIEKFDETEKERLITAVMAIDTASVVLVGHLNKERR